MSKYRHEYKYWINMQQEHILLIRASGILKRDIHTRPDGTYYIRSLYFDDYDDVCLSENEDGIASRSKFRIRYYNSDHNWIQLEKKSKKRGMTLKDSCPISTEECQMLINGMIPPIAPETPDEKKKLLLELQFRNLIPKVIVSYERIPFVYAGGNVRVTFDRAITSSNDTKHFLSGNYTKRPILPSGRSILEVKWNEVLPLHIKDTLKLDSLQWTTFSKYYMCRKYHL